MLSRRLICIAFTLSLLKAIALPYASSKRRGSSAKRVCTAAFSRTAKFWIHSYTPGDGNPRTRPAFYVLRATDTVISCWRGVVLVLGGDRSDDACIGSGMVRRRYATDEEQT